MSPHVSLVWAIFNLSTNEISHNGHEGHQGHYLCHVDRKSRPERSRMGEDISHSFRWASRRKQSERNLSPESQSCRATKASGTPKSGAALSKAPFILVGG